MPSSRANFPMLSFEQANPFLTGALKGQQFGQQAVMGPLQALQQSLANQKAQAELPYAGPMQQALLQNQQNVNKYYGPNIESEMALRGAQTGLTGEQAKYYGQDTLSNIGYRAAQKKALEQQIRESQFKIEHPYVGSNGLPATLQFLKDQGIPIEQYLGGNVNTGTPAPMSNPITPGGEIPTSATTSSVLGAPTTNAQGNPVPPPEQGGINPIQAIVNQGVYGTPFPRTPEEQAQIAVNKKMAPEALKQVQENFGYANNAFNLARNLKDDVDNIAKDIGNMDPISAWTDINNYRRNFAENFVGQFHKFKGTGTLTKPDLDKIEQMVPGMITSVTQSLMGNKTPMDDYVTMLGQAQKRAIQHQNYMTQRLSGPNPVSAAQAQNEWNTWSAQNPLFLSQDPHVSAEISKLPKDQKEILKELTLSGENVTGIERKPGSLIVEIQTPTGPVIREFKKEEEKKK